MKILKIQVLSEGVKDVEDVQNEDVGDEDDESEIFAWNISCGEGIAIRIMVS